MPNKTARSRLINPPFLVSFTLLFALLLFPSASGAHGLTAGALARRTPTPRPSGTPRPTRTQTAGSYTITALGAQANGINASGQVAGVNPNNHGFLWTPSQPNGTQGTSLELGTLGGSVSPARYLNGSGQTTGYSTLANGSYRAFLYSQGVLTNLGDLGSNYSAGYSINDSGQVVGSAMVGSGTSGNEHAFLWTPTVPNGTTGTMIDLGTLGGEYSTARGINGAGQVVGYAYRADGNFRAFLYSGGPMTDLGTLGGSYSQAYAISDAGRIVGQAYLPGNVSAHAFIWQNGSMSDLGGLGGNYSSAQDLTSDGTLIVGSATIPNGGEFLVYHAVRFLNGQVADLNNLIASNSGWVLSQASGVNDAGQIVGYGTLNGQAQGFLLTPR